jgi:UDP-N-acetylglucosamine 1-carboxyvinyltransferase
MDKFIVKGGQKLSGSLEVEGSKNAALPIILGALLIDKGETVVRNVPALRDIYTSIKVMEYLGAKVKYDAKEQVMAINASGVNKNTAPYELMRQMRASFLVLGPILARTGRAKVSLPGGCSIGARPVNFHITGFRALGAKVTEKAGYVMAEGKPLKGGPVYFDRPSHTGTENILFGAVFAKGKTEIANAACDPEIVDVASFLNKAGAKIHGAGTPTVIIEPVKRLKAIDYTVSGDRLVAGTYMFSAAITGGKLRITGFDPGHLTMVNLKLMEMGCRIDTFKNGLTVTAPKRLKPVSITTFPYPGFPTDLQACAMAAATLASGTSHIVETVFKDRYLHSMELGRLGADIVATSGEAIINGVQMLQGAEVMAPDIRAGAALVVACLAAQGKSEILRVYHIDRGYNKLEEKLAMVGADIKRSAG